MMPQLCLDAGPSSFYEFVSPLVSKFLRLQMYQCTFRDSQLGQHAEAVRHRHVPGLWVHPPTEMLELAQPAQLLPLLMNLQFGQR